jgi:hypothetical protein
MKEQVKVSGSFRIVSILLILTGAGCFVYGLFTDHKTAWANYLLVNYYFLSLAMGGAFFYVIQKISQSGWSSAFLRVPEAMMSYVPFAAIFMLLLYFGVHDIYPWTEKGAVALDPVMEHKSVFLNVPFFFARMIIYFILWIVFIWILRRVSLKEDSLQPDDKKGIMQLFARSELYSKIFIFISIITFSFAAIDWTMSIDSHWYSTIFAFKNLVGAFLHGVSVLILIVFILHKRGYFPFLNKYHLHDFARYLFMLSIVFGYLWFCQFMIIWYGNIPEETSYYFVRWQNGWKVLFFLEIGLNWGVPFMVLLPIKTSRNMTSILIVIILLIIGQYIDLFIQVIPGTTGVLKLGWMAAGMFIGYASLFALIVASTLSKARIIEHNHPYLEESLEHHFQ